MGRFNLDKALEWATALLVFAVALTMGTYAANGMNAVQWAGAAVSILGSVTLAVMVRVWPADAASSQTVED